MEKRGLQLQLGGREGAPGFAPCTTQLEAPPSCHPTTLSSRGSEGTQLDTPLQGKAWQLQLSRLPHLHNGWVGVGENCKDLRK